MKFYSSKKIGKIPIYIDIQLSNNELMKDKNIQTSIIFITLFSLLVIPAFSRAQNEGKVEVRNYNTIRITEDGEEEVLMDPEENKRILPYILEEDKLDLLGGGNFLHLQNLTVSGGPLIEIEILREAGYNPTLYVYYLNETKEANTVCIYENDNLIYYSRAAQYDSPFQVLNSKTLEEMKSREIDLKEYSFHLWINPEKVIDEDTAQYFASAGFSNVQSMERGNEFADAKIMVNGIQLNHSSYNNFFTNKNLELSVGDVVNVSIKQDLIGSLEYELTVPSVIDEMTITPPLEKGVPNTTDKYLMQWDSQECNSYAIRVHRYLESGKIDSYGETVTETFHQWRDWELKEEGEIVPYLEFELKTANKVHLPMFDDWSNIEVTAPSGVIIGNWEGENL